MNSATLEVLIEHSREGDANAFREIFEHLNDRLFRYALAHTKSRDDALDIVQDTFIDLWKAIETFSYRSDEEFYGFVFLILKRKIAHHHRKAIFRISLPLDEARLSNEESYEMEYEDYRHLFHAMEKLAEEYQELLRLRYWAGMSFNEIALVLNTNENNAKVRHHRALQKLKDYLSSYHA